MAQIEWSQEFVERRMEEHRRWQNHATHLLLEEAIEEIQELPVRKPKSGYLFDETRAELKFAVLELPQKAQGGRGLATRLRPSAK